MQVLLKRKRYRDLAWEFIVAFAFAFLLAWTWAETWL